MHLRDHRDRHVLDVRREIVEAMMKDDQKKMRDVR
jgi:hypothetical protein